MPTTTPVGATIATGTYADATTRLDTANEYTNFVQRLEAQKYQKYYLNEGQYFTSIPADLSSMQSSGTTWIMCFKPNRTFSTAEGNKLTACCNVLINAGIPFIAVLWQECNDQNFFASGAAYKTYYNNYAPFIPSGVTRCFDPSGGTTDPTTYYPGDANVDMILLDQYGNKYEANPGYMAALAAICDAHLPNPIPFGIGEWGIASGNVVANIQEMIDISNAIISLFTARNTANKVSGPVCYWGGQGKNGNNIVVDANDPKIPYIQAVHDALQGAGPPPPPTAQTIFGYPDYQRVVQGQSSTFNQELINIPVAGKVAGPFYMGTASQVLVSLGVGTGPSSFLGVNVQWYADSALTQLIGGKSFVSYGSGQMTVPITNLGAWMTVTVTPMVAGHSVQVYVISYNTSPFVDNLLSTDAALFNFSFNNVVPNTDVTEPFNDVFGGPVILHADAGAALFTVKLFYVSFKALGQVTQFGEIHSQDAGQRFDRPLALPWSPVTIEIKNVDPANNLFANFAAVVHR